MTYERAALLCVWGDDTTHLLDNSALVLSHNTLELMRGTRDRYQPTLMIVKHLISLIAVDL